MIALNHIIFFPLIMPRQIKNDVIIYVMSITYFSGRHDGTRAAAPPGPEGPPQTARQACADYRSARADCHSAPTDCRSASCRRRRHHAVQVQTSLQPPATGTRDVFFNNICSKFCHFTHICKNYCYFLVMLFKMLLLRCSLIFVSFM